MNFFLITPTLQQGGAERVIIELANEFCTYKEVKVHLVLLAKSEDFYSVDKRIKIHRLGFENEGKIQKLLSELRTLKNLRSLFKRECPDTILSFQERFNSFAIIASFGMGIPIYVSDRSNPLKPLSYFNEKLRKYTYKHASGIIAQTTFAKEILTKKIKNKNIKVIPNPIKNIKLYPEVEREKIILNVGRLVPEKGQKYLIDAFSRIDGKDWKLVILGEGVLRSELEMQITQLKIQDKVELLGSVKNVDSWLAKSSIFAFPSISEGFPNALAEAMISGIACVSFDCKTGPSDLIINEVNGFLIKVGDVHNFTLKIQKLIDNAELNEKISMEARKISDQLNSKTISQIYFEFCIK